MLLQPAAIADFQETVWQYYHSHARSMPWRDNPTPYYVLVSELMLQQTQVSRVVPKFHEFIRVFPDVSSLASAPLAEVLQAWSGLGYNRRAKYLHLAAKEVMNGGGEIPDTLQDLVKLPGIGINTAGAILNYAYQQPVPYVETNIRTVLLHHFFADNPSTVDDKTLLAIADQVLDTEHPREWHWALMDYGTYLKRTAGGRLDQSKHYKKQAPLKGSLREMRGRIVKTLAASPLNDTSLRTAVAADERYDSAMNALISEGMVSKHSGTWCLAE